MTQTPVRDGAQTGTVAAIHAHHAQLTQELTARVVGLRDAAERLAPLGGYRDELLAFVRAEVLPHAAAEEKTLYAAGAERERTALLVEAMTADHRVLEALVEQLAAARTPVEMVGFAAGLRTLFEAHLAKENDQLLPALVVGGVDLGALLGGMHQILGGHEHEHEAVAGGQQSGGCGCGGCGCGGGAETVAAGQVAEAGDLDVRALPHALRHEEIFKAVGRLSAGESFVIANDHDPKPLRYQLEAAFPGHLAWDYLAEGPELWRVRIGRVAVS